MTSVAPHSKQSCESESIINRRLNQCQYYLLRYVPGINLFYDLLFDETPSPESIKDLLNLVGLVDALMLSIVITYLSAVDYDDMEELDQRFMVRPDGNETGYFDAYFSDNSGMRFSHDNGPPSTNFALECVNSIAFLFGSLCLSLMAYTDLVNKNFKGETSARTEELVAAWWYYARIGVFLAVLATVVGVCICMGLTVFFVTAKFPDYYVEEHGEAKHGFKRPYGQANWVINWVWVLFFFSLITLGIGTYARFKRGEAQAEHIDQDLRNETMARSRQQWAALFELTPQIKEYFSAYAEDYVSTFVAQRVDFENRSVVTDDHLRQLEFDLIGHRIKMLDLFSDPSVGPQVAQIIAEREKSSNTASKKVTAATDASKVMDIDDHVSDN